MKNQTVETAKKWEPVEGLVTPAGRVCVAMDDREVIVTMVFSEIVDGLNSDLRITFGRVPAFAVHEEFIHPWNSSHPAPRLGGKWEAYTYPLLLIQDSEWVHSLQQQLVATPNPVHYRFALVDRPADGRRPAAASASDPPSAQPPRP